MKHRSPGVAARSESAAEALYAFWTKGRTARDAFRRLAVDPDRGYSYGFKAEHLAAQAEHAALNPDLMRKAVTLATEYTDREVRSICALVRKSGSRFSSTHLVRLLSLPDKAARDAVIREAIQKGWSVGQLTTELVSRRGRRPGVGKKPRLPAGRRRLLADLEARCLTFSRWIAAARSRLPDEVGGLADAALKAADALRAAVVQDVAGRKSATT